MSTDQAHRNLVAAIFNSARLDLKGKNGLKAQYDAMKFFQSDYAECLANYLDIDINEIRKALKIETNAR